MLAAKVRQRVAREVQHYAQLDRIRVSLHDLVEFGKNRFSTGMVSGQYLHREFRIRYAKNIKLIEALPGQMNETRSIKSLNELYYRSFNELLDCEVPEDDEQLAKFTSTVHSIRNRLDDTLSLLAQGFHENGRTNGKSANEKLEPIIKPMIDTFINARIGSRLLQVQHLSKVKDPQYDLEGFFGAIQSKCNPADIAASASEDAKNMCTLAFGESPEIEIIGQMEETFTYPPSHLYHIIFELLKNSLRATLETHKDADDLPPVVVIIAKGKEDMSIKVQDKGGGILRKDMDKIWKYFFTTAGVIYDGNSGTKRASSRDTKLQYLDTGVDVSYAPFAGYGFGLPVSRLYARYFGGDIALQSMDGYGTDAYIYLDHLNRVKEPKYTYPPSN